MPRNPDEGYYDALICRNGHTASGWIDHSPDDGSPFCGDCGAPTVRECENCSATIRGYSRGGLAWTWSPAAYCYQCGQPYPWTADGIAAAREIAEMLDGLTPEERAQLANNFDDLTRDTPRTSLAVLRTKTLLSKARGEGVGLLRTTLGAVVTAAVKQQLGLP